MAEDDLSGIDIALSPGETALLRRYRFDGRTFAALRQRLADGAFTAAGNRVSADVAPPAPEDLTPWPGLKSADWQQCEELGAEALRRGEVAVAILNGGMATRFGGVVKGIVPVLDGQSFLALKLKDVGRAPGRPRVFLMNSFATEAATALHLAEGRWFGLGRERVHTVDQGISVRLRPNGEIFRTGGGGVSLYAPGHGDLLSALARADAFQDFVDGGGKYVLVSNVDNLAATVSPVVVGAHIGACRPVTVEVVDRTPGDSGGAPVWLGGRPGGRLEVLEGFRFPTAFDIAQVPVFNTNTFVLDVSAISGDHPLNWFRADKLVDGEHVVQFERLLGEVTSFVDAQYLKVPRQGRDGRFLPVKVPDDIELVRPSVRRLFGENA